MKSFVVAFVALAASIALPAAAEPVQLKFGYAAAATSSFAVDIVNPWAEDVMKASQGTVEVKLFPGSVLGNAQNIYDRIITGVAELTFSVFGPLSSQFPKTNVATLPFETRDETETALALWRLYDKGVIADEFSKVRVLALMSFPSLVMHSSKPIATMEDMRGLKVSAEGRVFSESLQRLGAAPVTLQPIDLYQSKQRGVVDVVAQAWPSVTTFKLFEVADHHLEGPFGANTGYVVMNKEAYAKLPAAGRAALDAQSYEAFVRRIAREIRKSSDQSRAFTQGKGQSITQLSPAEEARWKAQIAPVTEEWVKATPDGARVLAAYRAEIAAIRAGR